MKKLESFFALTVLLMTTSSSAATLYVSNSSGNNSGNCTSQTSPCKSIVYAIGRMSGGDTLEIAAGIYSGVSNTVGAEFGATEIPSGSASAYTIIKASEDGTVDISAPFAPTASNYFQLEGLKLSNIYHGVAGHHIKIFRTAIVNGDSNGNVVAFSIGTNESTPGATHILLEDVWVYGPGGRYDILIYNSEDVVIRRAVLRHDGGWNFDGSNPEASINIYNSRRVELQNVIVIDAISSNNDVYAAAFYNIKNDSSGTIHADTRIVGSIAFNNSIGNSFAYEGGGSITNAVLENSVSYNGAGLTTNNGPVTLQVRNVTMVGGGSNAFSEFSNNSNVSVTNSIIHQYGGEAFNNITSQSNNNCSSGCSLSFNPETNGLLYLPRIEVGSTLASSGSPSGQVGAKITNKVGLSGTYYGETGFNVEQGSLWPWPLEDRIYADLCSTRNDGLCDGNSASLTDYIWSALGNGTPGNIQPMPKPTGVNIIKN